MIPESVGAKSARVVADSSDRGLSDRPFLRAHLRGASALRRRNASRRDEPGAGRFRIHRNAGAHAFRRRGDRRQDSLFRRELGLLVFLAMFLHKIPDGFTIASIVRSTGHTAGRALAASALLGVSTLVGVVAFYVTGAKPEALSARGRLHAVCCGDGPHARGESGARREDGATGFCGDGIVSAGESDRAGNVR